MATIQNIPVGENLRDSNPKINGNFSNLNTQLVNHVAGTADKHPASDITYNGDMSGSNVNQALDNHINAQTGSRHGSDDIDDSSDAGGVTVRQSLDGLQGQVNVLATAASNATIGVFSVIASGTNTYTGTFTGVDSYFANLKIDLKISNANTGAATFNLNSLGAKNIKLVDSSGTKYDPAAGDLYGYVSLQYDGTDFILQNVQPYNFTSYKADIATLHVSITNPPNGLTAAKPNDSAFDNRPTINAIIDYVSGVGGGSVVIPSGVFYSTSGIVLKSNVHLFSFGGGTIRAMNNIGDYYSFIDANDVSNVNIYGIAFDMNEQNNSTANISMTESRPHHCINIARSEKITVEKCRFINVAGVCVIQHDGVHVGHNTKVKDNYILWMRSPTTATWYDNTCIRVVNSYYAEIINNYIACNDLTDYAECAIDSRSYGCIVSGNKSKNFTNFMDVVAAESTPTDHPSGLLIKNNIVYNTKIAIMLWSNSGEGLKDVVIEDNVIQINQLSRNADQSSGVYVLETNSTLTLKNVKILNNTIKFELGDTRTVNVYACGIQFGSNINTVGLIVKNNTIQDSPQHAIQIGNATPSTIRTIENVEVTSNLCVNCQRASGGGVIIYGGNLKNTVFKDNTIFDDGATPYASKAWVSSVTSDYSGIRFVDNKINCINGKLGKEPAPFFGGLGSVYGLIYQTYAQLNTSNYRNVLANDVVILENGVYKVTAYGTYGTLTGVTGSIASGSKNLTVNDATNINVWDKINIGGVIDTYVVNVKGTTVVVNDAAPSAVTNGTIQRTAPTTVKLNVNT